MVISFKVSKEDALLIGKIVKRAMKIAVEFDVRGVDALSMHMDITACHANGCPLDLQKLLTAPKEHFTHDVFGIFAHIKRDTGTLRSAFLPRCAKHNEPAPV